LKAIGVTRKLDELGRITLPIGLRRDMNIQENIDLLEMYVEGETIILKKYTPKCVFCGNTDDVCKVLGKNVCGQCKNELKK
jgi:transcriptional pleiotropic regulator of transition state genes